MPHVFGQHVHTIGLDQLTFHFALHTGPALARVFYFSRSLHLDGREVPRDASGPVRRAVWRRLPLLVCLSVRRTHREGCCPCHSVVVYSQLDESEGDGREMRVDRCGVLCGGNDRLGVAVCVLMMGCVLTKQQGRS